MPCEMAKTPNPRGDEWEIQKRRYKIWILFLFGTRYFTGKNVIFLRKWCYLIKPTPTKKNKSQNNKELKKKKKFILREKHRRGCLAAELKTPSCFSLSFSFRFWWLSPLPLFLLFLSIPLLLLLLLHGHFLCHLWPHAGPITMLWWWVIPAQMDG